MGLREWSKFYLHRLTMSDDSKSCKERFATTCQEKALPCLRWLLLTPRVGLSFLGKIRTWYIREWESELWALSLFYFLLCDLELTTQRKALDLSFIQCSNLLLSSFGGLVGAWRRNTHKLVWLLLLDSCHCPAEHWPGTQFFPVHCWLGDRKQQAKLQSWVSVEEYTEMCRSVVSPSLSHSISHPL